MTDLAKFLADLLAEVRAIRAVVERLAPEDVRRAALTAENVAEGTKRVAGYRIVLAEPKPSRQEGNKVPDARSWAE